MFGILNAIISVVGAVVFITAISLGLLRLVLVMLFAALRQWRQKGVQTIEYTPPVTVLIAAHNEEKSIEASIRSALASEYPHIQVLIVDDGSTDSTAALVANTFGNDNRVQVLTVPNGGKIQALLHGASHIQTDVIVALDADTTVEPQAIANLVENLANEKVAAVAGNIAVRNQTQKIARYQALGYMSANMDRRALDLFQCVSVIPGAIGAWHKADFLHALGNGDIAGDCEITFAALRSGKHIRFADNAKAYTDAPTQFAQVLSQRKRWSAEKWQFMKRHGKTLLKQSNGFGDLIAGLHIMCIQAVLPLLLWWVDIFMAYRLIQAVLLRSFTTPAFLGACKLYIAYLAVEFARDFLATYYEKSEDRQLLKVFLPQSIWNRQIHGITTFLGFLALPKGVLVQWDNSPATSSQQIQDPPTNDSPPEEPDPGTYC
jgi:cellulose synthase/poly-beta-1,6-N-acetylglucosamine synthase-like glycosyltransferase